LTIPAQATQQLAIDIALPISLMIIFLGIIALISMRVNLRAVTGSLQSLATEAQHIATGRLDRPLNTEGVDELGELRRAFEQMRVSLLGRLQDLNRLYVASQGVDSSLTLGRALRLSVLQMASSRMFICTWISRSLRSPNNRNGW
jgi:methyl-accepting chemotaxis protein